MKKLLIAILCGLFITGCSSGVSQEEYDAVVEERDELQTQLETSESKTEFEKTASECKAKIEAEYEHAEFVFYVGRVISEEGMDEVEESVKSVYEESKSSIDTFYEVTMLADENDAADSDLFTTGSENIQNAYDTWNETYQAVIEMEDFIKGE